MKLKVKNFLSYGDLIIYDVIINGTPLRLKYGSEVDSSLFQNEDFKKSYKEGIIRKCINLGWIIEIEEEKEIKDKEPIQKFSEEKPLKKK
ncbi:MAG: hypothetical protein QXL51_00325 [Candidatus Aenigmatarchaeota archaeon]